jgi:hypothetical protein
MAKGEATVQELVDQIDRREIRLPEMQRQYVWRAPRVRDLFDSLYRGWPSGAILLWETDEDVALQDFAVSQTRPSQSSAKLLLDGQERLTSLSAVIRGEPIQTRGRKRPVELLFNLDHPEVSSSVSEAEEDESGESVDLEVSPDEDALEIEGVEDTDATDSEILKNVEGMTFIVKVNRIAKLLNWVSVSDVFANEDNVSFIREAGVTSMDDPRFTMYNDRLNRLRHIKSYVYRLDTLERALSYDEVTEIFVRVNSLGAKLRSSDLALAQITAKWRGSLSVFQSFQAETAKGGLDLDLGAHLRALVVMATGQSRFRTVGSLDRAELVASWESAVQGTNFASNFLRSNCGISSLALLSSPFLVTALSYYGHVRGYAMTDAESIKLRRWALLANAKGRYSRGSSESLLDQDLTTIRSDGGPDQLLDRLASQVGRLEVVEADLAGRNQRSSLFKTLFIALAQDGATDWKTGLKIALGHSGNQDRLQFHHIFPQDLLKARYSSQEIDDISNLAFIGGKTNRQILNAEPAAYLPDLVEKFGLERFQAHLVPLDSGLLKIEAYPQFLEARRALLAVRLDAFLNPKSTITE